jgi:hypothetical protein
LSYLYIWKVVNRRWKIIVYLMSSIKHDKVFNKIWKDKQNSSFWFARMDSEKADVALMHCLPWKYSQKKEDII